MTHSPRDDLHDPSLFSSSPPHAFLSDPFPFPPGPAPSPLAPGFAWLPLTAVGMDINDQGGKGGSGAMGHTKRAASKPSSKPGGSPQLGLIGRWRKELADTATAAQVSAEIEAEAGHLSPPPPGGASSRSGASAVGEGTQEREEGFSISGAAEGQQGQQGAQLVPGGGHEVGEAVNGESADGGSERAAGTSASDRHHPPPAPPGTDRRVVKQDPRPLPSTPSIEDMNAIAVSFRHVRTFYFAVPPFLYAGICRSLRAVGLHRADQAMGGFIGAAAGGPAGGGHGADAALQEDRFILEKPFGKDTASCVELCSSINQVLLESEIFRIDHYLGRCPLHYPMNHSPSAHSHCQSLVDPRQIHGTVRVFKGKELVMNVLVMRFANISFNAIWNREHISSVQVVCKESHGTEGRGGYFDQ